jgi:hypothetical protein
MQKENSFFFIISMFDDVGDALEASLRKCERTFDKAKYKT